MTQACWPTVEQEIPGKRSRCDPGNSLREIAPQLGEACMRSFLKIVVCPLLMLTAIAVFVYAAVRMLQAREPYYTWFYSFAWWSYIIFIEAFLHHRGGESELFGAPRRF